jgi:hypothetical protein
MANEVMYGFQTLQTLFDQRVEDVRVPVIDEAIAKTVALHNENVARMLELFVMRTTEYKVRYRTLASALLQPLEEHGLVLML